MKKPVIAKLKKNCPFQGNCLTANNLYKSTLSSSIPGYRTTIYLGICEPPFKSRLNSHNATFKNKKYETSTKLAGEVWKIKEQNGQYNIKWNIVKHFPGYNHVSKRCMLCTNEKLHTATHQNKFRLKNSNSND